MQAGDDGLPINFNSDYSGGVTVICDLTTGSLAARSGTPTLDLSYGYTRTPSAGCPTGTSSNAGANTNRLTSTFTSGTAPTSTSTYCYDNADRVLWVLGTSAGSYTRHRRERGRCR